MRIWDQYLTERDKQVFEKGGYGKRQGFGKRPALLVIDITYNFTGDKPEPILESIERFSRHSCGDEGWAVVHRLVPFIRKFREKKIPIFYSYGIRRPDFQDAGLRDGKSFKGHIKNWNPDHPGSKIVAEITPHPEDILIEKKKPSVFFFTPFITYLIDLKVDTLILTGCTTSGCVRSTAIDSQNYNLRTIVVEDCVFDRGQVSHAISLFDLNAKYADVLPAKEVEDYLQTLPSNLYA